MEITLSELKDFGFNDEEIIKYTDGKILEGYFEYQKWDNDETLELILEEIKSYEVNIIDYNEYEFDESRSGSMDVIIQGTHKNIKHCSNEFGGEITDDDVYIYLK